MKKPVKIFNIDYFFYLFLILFFIFSLFFSTFRDAIKDEVVYIHETFLISELLRNGLWIGDYAVGLHGFISKIPPAIVFIFTGPSVFVLTIYNVLLACLACFLFYKFLKETFAWKTEALLAVGLLVSNFHFMLSTPSYLRETPSLVVVTLLLYGLSKNWKPWVLGIIFVLLLDAKEYLFFMFGLGYAIWIVMKYFKARDFKSMFLESFHVFGFSAIFVVLMLTTSAIPVNMFVASIMGFIDTGTAHLASQFAVDTATYNLIKDDDVKSVFQFVIREDMTFLMKQILQAINVILSYIGKILYPRTFSFIGVPKILILPAVYMAFKSLKAKGLGFQKLFSVLFFTYIALYLLRSSHGRYLLPLVPLISVFFILFISQAQKNKKEILRVLVATSLFMIFGFFFEESYVIYKIIVEGFLLLCITISVLKPFDLAERFYILFQKITIVLLILSMMGASLLFSFTQGQVKNFLLFGENRETQEIVEIIPKGSRVWINNTKSYDLFATKIGQTYAWPEWNWELAPYLPKKSLLKAYGKKYLYNDYQADIESFKKYFEENDISYVVFVESKIDDELFEYETSDFLDSFKTASWLKEEKLVSLKNKKVYIFKVDF